VSSNKDLVAAVNASWLGGRESARAAGRDGADRGAGLLEAGFTAAGAGAVCCSADLMFTARIKAPEATPTAHA
jgi:hypothetical protein